MDFFMNQKTATENQKETLPKGFREHNNISRGNKLVGKRSMRPNQSVKRLSILPKKFSGISRVQKVVKPQVKSSEVI